MNEICTATGCGAEEPCEHTYETKYDDNEHWEECSVCGEEKVDSRVTHTEKVTKEGKTETCEETGLTEEKSCEDCGVVLQEQEPIPALGHSYENGECTECGEKDSQGETEAELGITSETYAISGEYITKIQPGTTVSELKTNLSTNAVEIKIYNSNNEELSSSDKMGTGTRIELTKGEETKTFTIIVIGDINADAEADFKDIVKINQARLNRTTLEEIYALAADVNDDEEVDFKDLVKINRFRLNKITEL